MDREGPEAEMNFLLTVLFYLAATYTSPEGYTVNELYSMPPMAMTDCQRIAEERTEAAKRVTWMPKDIVYYCVPNQALPERDI